MIIRSSFSFRTFWTEALGQLRPAVAGDAFAAALKHLQPQLLLGGQRTAVGHRWLGWVNGDGGSALIEAAVKRRVISPQGGFVHLNRNAEEKREVILHMAEVVSVSSRRDTRRLET